QRGFRVLKRGQRFLEFGIKPCQLFQVFLCRGKIRERGRVRLVEQLISSVRRAVKLLRIRQDTFFRLELLVFARIEMRRFDFFFLETPEVGHTQAVLLVALELSDAVAHRGPSRMLRGQVIKVVARVNVQQRQSRQSVKGQNVFVLRVDGSQRRRYLAQQRHGGR